jgi:hypothetical protein
MCMGQLVVMVVCMALAWEQVLCRKKLALALISFQGSAGSIPRGHMLFSPGAPHGHLNLRTLPGLRSHYNTAIKTLQ